MITYLYMQHNNGHLIVFFPIIDRLKNKNIYFAPCGFSNLYDLRYFNYYKNIEKYLKKFNTNILHTNNYRDALFFKKKNL